MRCTDVKRELSAFADGQVSPELRLKIEEHLNHCADCAQDYRELNSIIRLTTSTPRVAPPLSIIPEVKNRMRTAEATEKPSFFLRRAILVPSVAIVCLLLLVPVMMQFRGGTDGDTPLTVDAYLQEHIQLLSEQLLPQSVDMETVMTGDETAIDESVSDDLAFYLEYHYEGTDL